jgi:pimeloyl-ACP methyl ester carboxylesterase
MMSLELVTLLASDKVALPGLLYTSPQKTVKAAIWLHGMGENGVFYKPTLMNTLGTALTERDIAFLAFNNRGANLKKTLNRADETLPEEDRRYQSGTHYELITDCIKDIDGAIDFLKQKGFHELYLLGHSTGAVKVCVYDNLVKRSAFKKYVLAGPGDDTGLWFSYLGERKFWKAINYAAKAVSQGDPQHIMPKYSGMHPFSAQSAWDILNPDGHYNVFPFYEATIQRLSTKPLFEEYRGINTPTLVIIGEQDQTADTFGGTAKVLDIMMAQTPNSMLKQTDFMHVAEANHSFHGTEAAFSQKVGDWLNG